MAQIINISPSSKITIVQKSKIIVRKYHKSKRSLDYTVAIKQSTNGERAIIQYNRIKYYEEAYYLVKSTV